MILCYLHAIVGVASGESCCTWLLVQLQVKPQQGNSGLYTQAAAAYAGATCLILASCFQLSLCQASLL